VSGYPANHGTSSPYDYGTNWLAYSFVVTNSVNTPADESSGTRYACMGWTGTGSVASNGNTNLVIFTTTTNSTLTWNWSPEYYLDTAAGTDGEIDVGDGWYTNNASVDINATASNHHHLSTWTGDVPPATTNDNPLTLTMDQPRDVTATFAPNVYSLTVSGDPAEHGTSSPHDYGTNGIEYSGSPITNTVNTPVHDGFIRYECDGWVGEGSIPSIGWANTVTFTITNSSVLTWKWSTDYYLDTETDSHGSVSVGDGWRNQGEIVEISPLPDANYFFWHWSGDVPQSKINDDPLSIAMSQPRSIMAHFALDVDGDFMDDDWERFHFEDTDRNGALDYDDDGLTDLAEFQWFANPTNSDTDADGLADGTEVNDYGSSPTNSDTDADGLTDGTEVNGYESVPTNPDTDADGSADGWEITAGTDPTNPASVFELTSVMSVTDSNVVLRWSSVFARHYTVNKATPAVTTFYPLAPVLSATPPENTYTDSMVAASMAFYRIDVGGGEPSWLSGWGKRIQLTISRTRIDSPLTNFPVLIRLSSSSGITGTDVTGVFDELGTNSHRIAVAMQGGTNECYVEIEYWDAAGEEAWLWVRAPLLPTHGAALFLYYDSLQSDNTDHVGTPGSLPGRKVWDSGYAFVSHMQDDPDSSHLRDSTANSYHGTKRLADNPNQTGGLIGSGQSFSAVNKDYVDLPVDTASGSQGTVSAWVKRSSTYDYDYGTVLSSCDNTHTKYWINFLVSTNGNLYTGQRNNDSYAYIYGDAALQTDTWHHVAFVSSGTNYSIYVDGLATTLSGPTDGDWFADTDNRNNCRIGLHTKTTDSSAFDGVMDEVRISTRSCSAAWIRAEYHSGNDSLLMFGSEEVP